MPSLPPGQMSDAEPPALPLSPPVDTPEADSSVRLSFDQISTLVAAICHTPIAAVRFVGDAIVGEDGTSYSWDDSICRHAVAAAKPLMVIPDVAADARFAAKSFVAGPPHLRFYAAAPLVSHEGERLGVLCVMDVQPRTLEPQQRDALRVLADHVIAQIEMTQLRAVQLQSRHRLQIALDAAGLGIFHWTVPRRVIHWDTRVKELFWLPPDAEIDTETYARVIHPEDVPRVQTALNATIERGDVYDVTYRTVAPDGRSRWVHACGRILKDATGRPVEFDGVARDVTASATVEHSLLESEAHARFLTELVESTRDLIEPSAMMAAVARGLGQHLNVSRCAYADVHDGNAFTIGPDYTNGCASCTGQYSLDAFGPAAAADMRAGRTLVLRDVDAQLTAADGAATFNAIAIKAIICCPLVRGGRLVGMMAVHQTVPRPWTDADVRFVESVAERAWAYLEGARAKRERLEAQAALLEGERSARSEIERVSRMKDEFLATLSHELRTPLNAILGWSQILGSTPGNSAEMAEGLDVIERNARSQAQIIEDLLDMSRIVSGKIRLDVKPLDINAVIQSAADTVRPAADARGVELLLGLDPTVGPISGDAMRLQQALWNLLSNAIKFTPTAGHVQVRVQRVNGHIEISVADTGQGIKPDFLPYVFDRFRQADASTTRRHGGLGIGLALVKQLVELHGGTVKALSLGDGAGATFVITLPLLMHSPEPAEETPRNTPAGTEKKAISDSACADLDGVRVLVVDDESDARSLVKRLLEDCNAKVISVGSAAEAVARVTGGEPFDVIVSDIGMPGEDGYAFIRRVRALPPARGGRTPAIALTAYARSEDRMRSVVAGFQMHIPKPVEAAELITMVATLAGPGVAGRRAAPDQAADPQS